MSMRSTAAYSGNTPRSDFGDAALRAAFAAGRALEQKFYGARAVQSKGYRDIVTDADFAADHAARVLIERAFPEHAIISEEDKTPPRRAEFVWLMDPLDGTTNYARQLPIFCTSICLTRRGQPLVGVVLDPLRDECFFAERGRGAFLNGTRLRASKISTLERAVIGYELAREPQMRALGLRLFTHFAMQSITARVGGSAALSLCYVGAGRLDTYMQLTLSPWDVAAGILVVREAGARVTHLNGKRATLKGGAYLAGAPGIFREFLKQASDQLSVTSDQ
ncbi:MAG: inositol monophosphatase [Chloroflexi bacterium]|nr:inositol monophosphatase [Chloroflexota bacterium]